MKKIIGGMKLINTKYFNLRFFLSGFVMILFYNIVIKGCSDEETLIKKTDELVQNDNFKFGYNLNNYKVLNDTVRSGDSFGVLLERNHLFYPQIHHIAEKTKAVFDVRQLRIGKPYTVLFEKDAVKTPLVFIYELNKIEYLVVEFCDSIIAYTERKAVKIIEKEAFGVIESSLSETMEAQGLPTQLIYDMSDDIYAWSIDFSRLQKGDNFKVIYKERFVEDSIYAGIETIEAAFFEHKEESFYAFNYLNKDSKNSTDYFDETTNSLRKAFLKGPVQFSRISSRFNLKRRIAYYGNKIRPHKGTDFAAPIGTPILATANGIVTESTRKAGNGKYVKIRHNATYSTQYLHMSKRLVKVGDYVKQGDVIGKVGMTGNTGGPHVCYRFWKNGKQVDPLRQKLPDAKALSPELKSDFQAFIAPLKQQLDSIK
ncbi:peptidoglycan DD-metalloendopeptidase family protein [Flavobacteriaceae bacterium]|nr:peptidoglycan DD-metalloendopeptidase family protein [Flavobacteriaceae bacterium]